MPSEGSAELRLILSKNISAKYIALSHCWGNCVVGKTTSQNFQSRLQGIPLSSLPQTFQDAVILCREFQIRYLWIDSLCIIQGDAVEWGREAGRMTSVYGNAYLVIAASASASDDVGIFPRRKNHYSHQFDFEWNGHTVSVRSQPRRHHYEHSSMGEGPLATRAWAYQERLLGPRLLSYHQDELHWECNETWRCECGVGDNIATLQHPYNLNYIFDGGRDNLNLLYMQWYQNIVERFSTRKLTKASDKLPAISGVAGAFRVRLKDEYLAGLWRNDFKHGLLWSRATGSWNWNYSSPSAYCAPSWSWASVSCTIDYKYLNFLRLSLYFDITDVGCAPVGEDRTGEVRDGWVTVSGLLQSAWLSVTYDAKDDITRLYRPAVNTKRHGGLEFGHVVPDCYLTPGLARTGSDSLEETAIRSNWNSSAISHYKDSSMMNLLAKSYSFARSNWRSIFRPTDWGPSSISRRPHGYTRVWCLKLADGINKQQLGDGKTTSLYMVLGRSPRERGKFERLGMLSMWRDDPSLKDFIGDAIKTTVTIL